MSCDQIKPKQFTFPCSHRDRHGIGDCAVLLPDLLPCLHPFRLVPLSFRESNFHESWASACRRAQLPQCQRSLRRSSWPPSASSPRPRSAPPRCISSSIACLDSPPLMALQVCNLKSTCLTLFLTSCTNPALYPLDANHCHLAGAVGTQHPDSHLGFSVAAHFGGCWPW